MGVERGKETDQLGVNFLVRDGGGGSFRVRPADVDMGGVNEISGDSDGRNGADFVVREGADVKVAPPPALKRAKIRKPRSKKVLDFTAPKRAKDSNKSGQSYLPAKGQTETEWLKSILPTPKTGAWWEAPPNDKGFLIKLRWRVGGKKPVYQFARLGKRELEELRAKTYDEQRRSLSGRIFRELYQHGERAISARITPYAGSGEIASGIGA